MRREGYMQALEDIRELLDNAVANADTGNAVQHYDYEIRDQLIMLEDSYNETS